MRNFLLAGVVPLLGFAMLAYIFGKARTTTRRRTSTTRRRSSGIEVPIAIGIGGLLLGVVAMLLAMVPYRDFFRRKPYTEVSPPGLLERRSSTPPAHLRGRRSATVARVSIAVRAPVR